NTIGNVLAGGSLALSAGRNITVDGDTFVEASAFSFSTAGLSATAGTAGGGGNISVLHAVAADSTIETNGGPITLTTGTLGTFTANDGLVEDVRSFHGNITVNADNIALIDALSLFAGSGSIVQIDPVTVNRAVTLGTKPGGTLGL